MVNLDNDDFGLDERYEELLYLSEWCNSLEEAMNWYNSKVKEYVEQGI